MKYIYQYDIAAVFVSFVMLIIFILRNRYDSICNKLFFNAIMCNLLSAVFDLVSIFTISYPERVSLFTNYFFSLGYLFFYNTMTLCYFRYIDAKGKIGSQKKIVRYVSRALLIYYALVIFSSPWTKLIAYFDEDLVYCHGPLYVTLFIIPLSLFIWEICVFLKAKGKFSNFQLIASFLAIFASVVTLIITLRVPEALIGTLVLSVALIFIYVTYENPAYYTYSDTMCLNSKALAEKLASLDYSNRRFKALIVRIDNHAFLRSAFSEHKYELIMKRIADQMYRGFKRRVYVINYDRFLVICDDFTSTEIKTEALFSEPLKTESISFRVDYSVYRFSLSDVRGKNLKLLFDNMECDINDDNLTEVFAAIDRDLVRNRKLLNSVKTAIREETFDVYFQPIKNLTNGKYESAEALIRLNDTDLGKIEPEQLIVHAEKNGVIEEVGGIVFRKVCEAIRDEHFEDYGIKYIEVNLSPLQCMNPSFADDCFEIMREYGIRPDQINFEITETAQFLADSVTGANIRRLNSKGISFAIDDYGTGFASAKYLTAFPISIVKIDRELLWDAMKDDAAKKVFSHSIRLMKDINKEIVVEGVETKEMLETVESEGCEHCQGFLFAKALERSEFVGFLKQNMAG